MLIAALLAGCGGQSGPPALNAAQQKTVGKVVGEAAVRCSLGQASSDAGFEDPTMQADLQALAAVYKKVGPKATLGTKSKQTLGPRVRKMIPELTCAPALEQVLITATGGPPHEAAQQAAKAARAEYAKCQGQVQGLLSQEQDLNSHLDVGMNFSDYTEAVGNVRAAYDQTPIHQMDLKCLMVGTHLEKALNAYVSAANTWNTCYGDVSCSNDSIQPQLQAQWSKAQTQLDSGQSALHTLQSQSST